MTAQRFKVLFSGEIAQGKSVEEVKDNLAALFKTDVAKIDRFFTGRPVLIKKDLEREAALKYQKAFEAAGAICEIRSMTPEPAPPPEKEGPGPGAVVCPSCGFRQERSPKCAKCGFTLAKPPSIEVPEEERFTQRVDPVERAFGRTAGRAEKSDRPQVGKIAAAALVILGLVFVYFWYVEARLQARSFEGALPRLGAAKFHIPEDDAKVSEGEVPFRTGRVLVVMVEYKLLIRPDHEPVVPPEIHPVWYRLGRSTRASEPSEIDTLIRIKKKIRGARLYVRDGSTESKVVSRHIYEMRVFDLREKSYIGAWNFDPGDFKGERMTRDDLEAMEEATSDDTVLELIESMPEK